MIKRSSSSADSVKVTFAVGTDECDQPVSVVGDFNGWDPLATPLRKRSNGTRSAAIEVAAGRSYRFKYLADDGSWFCDPAADDQAVNEYAQTDSVLVV
jgi:1,4-alpha-glucan branching enzyme